MPYLVFSIAVTLYCRVLGGIYWQTSHSTIQAVVTREWRSIKLITRTTLLQHSSGVSSVILLHQIPTMQNPNL